ncbi:potassium-transporting ATPase subunit KdpC [Raineyella sp. LH-20]|uniref:potassium-transporting ATPase subunit KdpC n=1 Tax=Raineyella sp. LH-20 TaxID=3081204 RepID=UPI0029551C8B|nr:potassium-transporting ATPase subunit KdpC [Raineyella sp. LH-20]WOP19870.1 potassium-transporting ATPase subunit KdpC [Raineyella sp. LH-20]
MNTTTRVTGRTLWAALRAMLLLTVLLGIVYPLVVTGVGQVVAPAQAHGSLVRAADGRLVGSALIGQSYADAHGDPLPQYFQPRPSAAGENGYDAAASAGSNLGPENPTLAEEIRTRIDQVAAFDQVAPDQVPADAVTASASGLDPDISPANAAIQVDRVARARGLAPDVVRSLVQQHTRGRDLGYLGEPRVNVLQLNLALDTWKG